MDRFGRSVETFSSNFYSILFDPDREGALEESSVLTLPSYFADLNLDLIVDAVTKEKREYALNAIFYSPLKDPVHIYYRQGVMKDLQDSEVYKAVETFADAMVDLRRHLSLAEKTYYPFQRERLFLEGAFTYCKAILALNAELSASPLQSKGMMAFADYLEQYCCSLTFRSLYTECHDLLQVLSSLRYGIYVRQLRVQVRRLGLEADQADQARSLFARFQGKERTVINPEDFVSPEMTAVEGRILEGIARLFPEEFERLKVFSEYNKSFLNDKIIRFDREVQFYISYLSFISRLKEKGLSFCYPELSATDKSIDVYGAFDLALADKLTADDQSIVCNDYALHGKERIMVVTGPNQGGKTTFSRMIGQGFVLACLGLPIPGTVARLFVFDQLFAHFEREEYSKDLRSKLEDDLVRLHAIMTAVTPKSVILLNEILSSATLRDAIELSQSFMKTIDQMDAVCIWVTFIDELITASSKAVSLVSEIDDVDPARRTFKVARKPANGLAYAQAIARKYRLSYDEIIKRLS